MKIYILVSVFILSTRVSIFSQNYINLVENTGLAISMNDNLFEATDSLIGTLPIEYRDSFKVISGGLYLHNNKFDTSLDEFIFRMTGLAKQKSPYFLLILRIFDEHSMFKEFRTILKLPEIQELNCYNQNYYLLLQNEISNKMIFHFTKHKISATNYYLSEIEGIHYLSTALSNIVTCCEPDLRSICHVCPQTKDLRSQFILFHLDSIPSEIIEIESSESGNMPVQKRDINELISLSSTTLLIDGVDTINLNEALEYFLSELQDSGYSYFAIISSDLNFCFTNETSVRSEETPSLEDLEELYNESNEDFVIWINASKSNSEGDKLFMKFRSKIDSYFDLPLHNDLQGYNASSNTDVIPHGVIYSNPSFLMQPYNSYSFTLPAVTFLSLVSDVPEGWINQTSIMKRGLGQYLPWYLPFGCGGAITIGDAKLNWYNIFLTQNFFKTDGNCPQNDIYSWLRICSHEVRHLYHINGFTGQANTNVGTYIGMFAIDYIIHLGHNNAPEELFANIGITNFDLFYDWIGMNKGSNALESILNNNEGWEIQSNTIKNWYNEYRK